MRFFYSLGVGVLGASLLTQLAAAQAVPCPPAGIHTDPAAPANPGGQPNTFNWYYGNYQPATYNGSRYRLNSPLPGVGQDYLELPWLQPTNPNISRFEGKIDNPADGWELVRRDLGYDDAGNPANTTNPTLIIYNRATGILRVFTAVGLDKPNFQMAEIKLFFDATSGRKAGTLNRQSALGVALEETEQGTNPAFTAVARYLNGPGKWFVADFPMDYDPCVCQNDSRLQIEVNLIQTADVKLVGKTTGSLVSVANGGAATGSDFDKGIPFIRKVNDVLDAGGKSYDNIGKFTDKMSALFPEKKADEDAFREASKLGNFLKDGLDALPYVGAAVTMLDFFLGGGKDAGPQAVVMQPMTIEMSTTTTGTISSTSLYTGIPFHNPGNRLASTIPQNMPYYNEALGVFSLLKRPTVDVQTTAPYGSSGTSSPSVTRYAFRLTEDLQYVINPAAKLEVQDFQAALVFEGPINAVPTRPFYDYGGIQAYEGTAPVLNANGTLNYTNYLYRTNYIDALAIKNNVYSYTVKSPVYGSYSGSEFYHTNVYLKVMVNLRRTDCSTCQNVLYVARYPVNQQAVDSYTTLPYANYGVLPQADLATINAVCQGPRYKQAIVMLRPGKVAGGSTPAKGAAAEFDLQAFPNPATGTVQLSYRVVQPGAVRITLRDALGREVRTISNQAQATAGSFETTVSLSGLKPGIYHCVLHTATQHVTKKIVIAD